MASPMPRLAPVISAIRSFRRIGGVSLFLAVFGEQGELLGTARRAGELVGQADRIVAGEAGIAEGRLGRIARRAAHGAVQALHRQEGEAVGLAELGHLLDGDRKSVVTGKSV